ncbi:unnamed protein product, partial [Rotaria magnacalcarata]
RPQQQQATYDGSSSSTWRLFGVHRLLN